MTRTIFKYPLVEDILNRIDMPIDAQVIHVDNQRGVLCLWADVSDPAPKCLTTFGVFGTGNPIPSAPAGYRWQHVGSAIVDPFVWHVYEAKLVI